MYSRSRPPGAPALTARAKVTELKPKRPPSPKEARRSSGRVSLIPTNRVLRQTAAFSGRSRF